LIGSDRAVLSEDREPIGKLNVGFPFGVEAIFGVEGEFAGAIADETDILKGKNLTTA